MTVDGRWSSWGSWSSCSRTCGAGVKRRDRDCDDPQPQIGGDDCSGSDEQTNSCEERQCSGILPFVKGRIPPPPDEMYSFVFGIVDNSMYYHIYTCWVGGEKGS